MRTHRPLHFAIRGLLVALLSTAALATPAQRTTQRLIVSGNYAIALSDKDLVVRRGVVLAFSARAFAAAQQAALDRQLGSDGDTVSLRHRFSFVSLTGTLLAIRDDVVTNEDAPLPGATARLWTIDLRQQPVYRFANEEPLRPLPGDRTLLDLRHVFGAPFLATAIGSTDLGARMSDSPARRDIEHVLSDLSRRGMASGHCFEADKNITSSFAIVGRAGRLLTVRLGLPGRPTCRGALTTLDITLPAKGGAPHILAGSSIVTGTGDLPVAEVRTATPRLRR